MLILRMNHFLLDCTADVAPGQPSDRLETPVACSSSTWSRLSEAAVGAAAAAAAFGVQPCCSSMGRCSAVCGRG